MNLHICCFTKKNVKNNKSHYYYLIKLITCIPEQKKNVLVVIWSV